MPLHLHLSGRHIATLSAQHLTAAALIALVALVFGVYVHVLHQAVEQGRRHVYQMQSPAVPANDVVSSAKTSGSAGPLVVATQSSR